MQRFNAHLQKGGLSTPTPSKYQTKTAQMQT